ncbi:MAG: Crp/Fnr family transcriptional regulator [Pyrinomonadaceae bacterium]
MQNDSGHSFNYTVKNSFKNQTRNRQSLAAAIKLKGKLPDADALPNQIINSLPSVEFAYFLSFAKRINLSASESIYRHGDNIESVYFPETAVLSQFQVLEDGRTCEIAMIGREGFVGLPKIFASATANCWTEVSVAGSALKIDGELFRHKFSTNSLLRAKMNEYANYYIEQLSQRIVCNYFHQIKERFCSWLLMLQDRRKDNKFSFTHEGIARLLGVHRPSLSGIAKELQQKEIISYSRGQIIILDRKKLETSACACCLTSRNHFAATN